MTDSPVDPSADARTAGHDRDPGQEQASGQAAALLGAAFCALQFYTRIPRPAALPWRAEDARHAGAFAPLVGILIGGFGAVVWWLAANVLPAPLPAVLAGAAVVWLTGALHEDGLADVFDAFGARGGAARTLDILKEPQLGVYGVLALLVSLAIRIVALAQIAAHAPDSGPGRFAIVLAAFIAAHAVSRFAAVSLMRGLDYVRADDARSRVAPFAAPLRGRWLAIATASSALALLPLVLLGLSSVLWVLPVVAITALWLRAVFYARIGGYTGDCLGCMQQLAEVLIWLAVAAALFEGSV